MHSHANPEYKASYSPTEKRPPPCDTNHHFRTPGIPSSPSSPPECLFLPPNLIGELFTKVGPLEAGLAKAGVETLFDLNDPGQPKRAVIVHRLGRSCLPKLGNFDGTREICAPRSPEIKLSPRCLRPFYGRGSNQRIRADADAVRHSEGRVLNGAILAAKSLKTGTRCPIHCRGNVDCASVPGGTGRCGHCWGGCSDVAFLDGNSWFDEFGVVFGEDLGMQCCLVLLLRCREGY